MDADYVIGRVSHGRYDHKIRRPVDNPDRATAECGARVTALRAGRGGLEPWHPLNPRACPKCQPPPDTTPLREARP